MDARLQRRIQRYGWDLAVDDYARHWLSPLAGVQLHLMALADLRPGERVLDVACGTGAVTCMAARAVGEDGGVLGVDLSGAMAEAAQAHAQRLGLAQARFLRMDAEHLALPDACFDGVLCSLGLMYMPDPLQALREMQRTLRPGGRVALAVWGERSRCGWAELFGIVDAQVRSEVCPLFFSLGQGDALPLLCRQAGLDVQQFERRQEFLAYPDADAASQAALAGGPVALAWSRFDATVRARVKAQYLASIEPWRNGTAYRVPAEFVLVLAESHGRQRPGC